MSPYDQRPVTASLMRGSDQGYPSAYPGQQQQGNISIPQDQQTAWMRAAQRRLNPQEQKQKQYDQGISGKSSDGKGLPDNLQPSYMRGSK